MVSERSTVAGHQFLDTPCGEACACGKTWLYVLDRREQWRPEQLNAKLQRIWDAGMRF